MGLVVEKPRQVQVESVNRSIDGWSKGQKEIVARALLEAELSEVPDADIVEEDIEE